MDSIVFTDTNTLVNSYAFSMLKSELSGIYGSELLYDLNKIINYYNIYEKGSSFKPDTIRGIKPSETKYKLIKTLIDKEARFMFGRTPTIYINAKDNKDNTSNQTLVNEVLKKNNFASNLIKAARDCFIGERVALFVNFNEDGIQVNFAPSLEFIYETDENDVNKITKVIRYYTIKDSFNRQEQRIYKKKYWLENGVCHISEEIYDGIGNKQEIIYEDLKTPLSFIPVFVIVNDGLTGDVLGESEVEQLWQLEADYSKGSNGDMDSLRAGMNQIIYTINMSSQSTENLTRSPGAFWDLATEEGENGPVNGSVGTIENSMSYSNALDTTLNRIKETMYAQLDIPDTTTAALKGIVSSGKTMKAIYWSLSVRCDEKMLIWKSALEWLANTIIKGAIVFKDCCNPFSVKANELTDNFSVLVDSNYSIMEDEMEEKQNDMQEVIAQVRSKKSYMKKWFDMTDEAIDEELKQIAYERSLLEDSFMPNM